MADNYGQIYTFVLYSALIGMLIGTVYDVFGFIRIAYDTFGKRIARNIAYFVCDILFFTFAAVISAIFIFHVNNGRIRGIALLGSLIGFVVYYHTLGRIIRWMSRLAVKGIRILLVFISKRIITPVRHMFSDLCDYAYTRRMTRRRIRSFKRKGC